MEFDKDTLIGKYLSGNASPEEKKQLEEWVLIRPENGQQLEETKKLWKAAAHLKKESAHNAENAWKEFQEIVKVEPKVRKLYLRPLKIAAVIVLCLSTAFVVRFFLSDSPKERVLAQKSRIVKPIETLRQAPESLDTAHPPLPLKKITHQHAKLISSYTWSSSDTASVVLLPDGSKVHLNRFSRITYTRSGRTVSLEGEAFFEVMPDSIPFYVSCKNTLTRAIGTSFNVRGSDQEGTVEITVLIGLVEVSDKITSSSTMEVKAGDQITCRSDHSTFVKSAQVKKEKWWSKNALKNKIRHFFNKLRHKSN